MTVTETPETPYPGGGNGGQVISGSAGMVPNDQIDLDTGSVLIDGGDMLYRQNEQGGLGLVPQGGTFAVMAFSQPGYNACKNAALSSGTMRIRDLQAGIYVCYRTDQGMYGWIKLAALEEATSRLSFQYNTWLNP